jgi:DNA-binding transcriptional LysR family regulator
LGLINRQILRQEMGRYPLAELPVKEFTYFTPHSIVYRKGAYLSPAALRLIAILKAQAKEMPAGSRVARMK